MARGSGRSGGGGRRGRFGRGDVGGSSGEGGGNTYHFDVTRAMSEVAKLKKPVEKKLVEKKPEN